MFFAIPATLLGLILTPLCTALPQRSGSSGGVPSGRAGQCLGIGTCSRNGGIFYDPSDPNNQNFGENTGQPTGSGSNSYHNPRDDIFDMADPGSTVPFQQFYLVTTNQSDACFNSSCLPDVSAITPYFQNPLDNTFSLRLLKPGYNSLPSFSLESGTLTSSITTGHGNGPTTYYSTDAAEGQKLQFLPNAQPEGSIRFKSGYLVTAYGETGGWTICNEMGTQLIYWKGAGSNCRSTHLHAVEIPPYKKK